MRYDSSWNKIQNRNSTNIDVDALLTILTVINLPRSSVTLRALTQAKASCWEATVTMPKHWDPGIFGFITILVDTTLKQNDTISTELNDNLNSEN